MDNAIKKKSAMKKKTMFWKAQRNAFLSSFKRIPRKTFFYSALFDFLCLFAFLVVLWLALGLINAISFSSLDDLNTAYQLQASGQEEEFKELMSELAPALNRLLIFSAVIFIISFVLVMFFCAWFYGNAWYVALKKKFSSITLKRYFKLNLAWFIIWMLLMFLTVIIFKLAFAAILLILGILVFFYLDYVLRTVFDESKGLKDNFMALFSTAKHVGWFLLFIVICIIVWFILMFILNLVAALPGLFMILFIILMLLFIGWSSVFGLGPSLILATSCPS